MPASDDTGVTARPISATELREIKDTLAVHVAALVAAAHTTKTGTLIAEIDPEMRFRGAQVVPDGAEAGCATGPAPAYRVRLCRIVAWRPWVQREIEAAVAAVEAAAIVW